MRVLGIDPGLTRCGVGVVDGDVGRPLTLVGVGVVRTASDLPVAQRLVAIEAGLEEWIERRYTGEPVCSAQCSSRGVQASCKRYRRESRGRCPVELAGPARLPVLVVARCRSHPRWLPRESPARWRTVG